MNNRYVVVGCTQWARDIFNKTICKFPGKWYYIDGAEPVVLVNDIAGHEPRFVFFLHWREKVNSELLNKFECVNFHMTDLPYGRGGSPLQNLIEYGHKETVLTAHRMVEEVDAGPVYLKKKLSLEGSAADIYKRAMGLAVEMIKMIVAVEPIPEEQEGEPFFFTRRTPDMSRIERKPSLERLYDFIRMLDAPGYPAAFIEHMGFRYEFGAAKISDSGIEATVKIREI